MQVSLACQLGMPLLGQGVHVHLCTCRFQGSVTVGQVLQTQSTRSKTEVARRTWACLASVEPAALQASSRLAVLPCASRLRFCKPPEPRLDKWICFSQNPLPLLPCVSFYYGPMLKLQMPSTKLQRMRKLPTSNKHAGNLAGTPLGCSPCSLQLRVSSRQFRFQVPMQHLLDSLMSCALR